MKELIIIGAGPAGMAASIYAVRAGLDTLVLEKISPGGQVMLTYEIENYPGFVEPVEGWQLASNMEQQARRLGVTIESKDVESVKKINDIFEITTTDGSSLQARAVIAATGASLRRLGVPGESEFTGRGVSYCATCDAAFFKDMVTAVVGGGNTALEEALYLTRFASKVYLIHRRDEFRGQKILQDRVKANPKIELILDTVVTQINGDEKVKTITLLNKKNNKQSELTVDGLFIFIGFTPNTAYLPKEILNEAGQVKVDMQMRTPVSGLFAAGDLREGSYRQVLMAAADGATASISAYEYITHKQW
ncbi:MAG: thioredoxin-disulfide reductase [Spirochaetes bacterium]|nr:thioredoxin-disulfide reductase [Spirochaetota bacterium]